MLINDNQYLSVVEEIKTKIQTARHTAMIGVNHELIMLYYNIGRTINEHKSWGNKFIDNLSKDIKIAYPDVTGYSVRNLKYMARFAAEYPIEIVQEVLAQITWYHNLTLMDKIDNPETAVWYAKQAIQNGWSRNVLVHQIASRLYERQETAQKVSNFESLLPLPQSELALQTMKDPYIFDFIPFKTDMLEREVENALIKNITSFLLELGLTCCSTISI